MTGKPEKQGHEECPQMCIKYLNLEIIPIEVIL